MAGKKRRKRWLLAVLAVLLVLGISAWQMWRRGTQTAQTYRTCQAETGDLEVYFSFTGNVQATNMQSVSAPSDGSVRELYVSPNDRVERGQRLMRMEDGKILRSDMAGEITELSVRQGDYVSGGRTLLVITDMSRLQVEIRIDEYDVEAVRVGQEVDVNIVALDRMCRGVICAFNKQGETGSQLSSYRATVDIQSPPETLLPGMQVEVTVLRAAVRDAVLLPRETLQFHEDGTAYVLLLGADGRRKETDIATGISDGITVEVTEGLAGGETVCWQPKDHSFDGFRRYPGGRS